MKKSQTAPRQIHDVLSYFAIVRNLCETTLLYVQ